MPLPVKKRPGVAGFDFKKNPPVAEAPTIPRDLDSRTSITIDDKTFSIEADDLESLCVLGRGAYGVVEKVKHKQTGTTLAVKVILFCRIEKSFLHPSLMLNLTFSSTFSNE